MGVFDLPKLINITDNRMNPGAIFAKNQRNSDPTQTAETVLPGNIEALVSNIPQDRAEAWWQDFQKQALDNPDGPYRDLTNGHDQQRLFIVNSGDYNESKLQPVSFDPAPDPRTLYAYAQNGRLLLSPMGRTDFSYQIQVNSADPARSDIVPFEYSDLLKNFPDPRQGIAYFFMRALNVITFGNAFADDLKEMDAAAATLESMRNAMTKTFLTEDAATRERNDPRCMANARGKTAAENYAVRVDPVREDPDIDVAVIQMWKKRDYTTNLEDFNDYVYTLFTDNDYPKPLKESRLTKGPPEVNALGVDLGNLDFTVEQVSVMAFLAVADPSLNYYQSQHPAGYATSEEQATMLSGNSLAEKRFNQLIEGGVGKPGSLDAVYDPCKQASIKIGLLLNRSANMADLAQPIKNGLKLVQGILQNSKQADDRFLFAAALSKDILSLLLDHPELLGALESQGFEMDYDLLQGASNFYEMQTKAVRGEFEIMQQGRSPFDKSDIDKNMKINEDDLEHLAWVTQSRYQMQSIKANGLQKIVRSYAIHNLSDTIHQKIQDAPQFQQLSGTTYAHLADLVSGGVALTKLCTDVLSESGKSLQNETGKTKDLNLTNKNKEKFNNSPSGPGHRYG